jgi:antitoxin HicB
MTDNPYTGSSFDDFLQEEGLYTECSAIAIKMVSQLGSTYHLY